MDIPLYQVDAFTDRVFFGNPAAVCPLPGWLSDGAMQAIGLENRLPETAFIVDRGDGYDLRWFTPSMEAELCGHATLAAAHVVFHHLHPEWDEVTFHSGKGPLVVTRRPDDKLALSFPAMPSDPIDPPPDLIAGLSAAPVAVYAGMDYLVIYSNEAEVRGVVPDQERLERLDRRAVTVTAPGVGSDFVSRFFAPKQAIPEDSFTGSAHCQLIPFWATELGREELTSVQFSTRLGGSLAIQADCELRDDRVVIAGSTRQYMTGVISVADAELELL